MARSFKPKIIIALAAFLLLLPMTPAQKYTPPFPADMAKKVGDNQQTLEWDVTWEKGKSTGMHKLDLDQVAVTMAEGAVKVTRPDGTYSIEEERFGDVRFESNGTQIAREGIGGTPARQIIFELKDAPPIKYPQVEGIPDQFPRVGAYKLFENDRINVWDQVWKAGWDMAYHLHYKSNVALFLEGGKLRTRDQGSPAWNPPFERKAGDLLDQGPIAPTASVKVPHTEEVVEGNPHVIWIEFK